jgi:hypothetical protein
VARLPGLRCPTIRTAGPGGRIPAVRARFTPPPRPVPRDCVTPPCCGRGGVTRSFSCQSAAAPATQVTDQRRLRSSGGGQSWPDPSPWGRRATSLGRGAAAGTSAASVTFAWLIRAWWWFSGLPYPRSTAGPGSTGPEGSSVQADAAATGQHNTGWAVPCGGMGTPRVGEGLQVGGRFDGHPAGRLRCSCGTSGRATAMMGRRESRPA